MVPRNRAVSKQQHAVAGGNRGPRARRNQHEADWWFIFFGTHTHFFVETKSDSSRLGAFNTTPGVQEIHPNARLQM